MACTQYNSSKHVGICQYDCTGNSQQVLSPSEQLQEILTFVFWLMYYILKIYNTQLLLLQ